MSFAQPFSGIVYCNAGLFGSANEIDKVLTAFQEIGKHTTGRIELLTSIIPNMVPASKQSNIS